MKLRHLQTDLEQELARQRARAVELLDQREVLRVSANARVARQRRYYQPKHNGLGRPSRKLRPESQESKARRKQYEAEILLFTDIRRLGFRPRANLPVGCKSSAAMNPIAIA